MPRSRLSTDPRGLGGLRAEAGSASVEFITAGLLLLVPTVYLVLALAALQSAAFAVEGAARQASRVYVQAPHPAAGAAAAARAIEVTLADYGLEAAGATVAIACRPDPGRCLTPRGFVTVTVSTLVPLPLLPPVLGVDLPAGIPMTATATEQVSRFHG